jgi:LTXXQ motif family protein
MGMLPDRDFYAELSLLTIGPDVRRLAKRGRSLVRSAILIFIAILAFGTTPARAQGTWLDTRMIRAMCSSKATPADNTDRLARRLNLTDPQKEALKDLTEASASALASTKTALCADKPDLSTTPDRMAFAKKMAETNLAGLKAVEPKLQAFYDSLDAKQKKAFDTGGRIGGMFDWLRRTLLR